MILRPRWELSRPPDVPFELNSDSEQAVGLLAWWPTLASRGGALREFLRYGTEAVAGAGFGWVNDPVLGPSLQFANDDGRVTAERNYGLTGADTFSLSVWFRPTTIPSVGTRAKILTNENFGGWRRCGSFYIYEWGSRTIKAEYDDDGPTYRTLEGPVAVAGQLYHAIFVNDPPGTRLYIDGLLADSRAGDKVGDAYTVGDVAFGAASNGILPFIGNIGDIRLLKIAVNDALAWQMYANPWELIRPLRRWWAISATVAPTIAMDTLTLSGSAEILTVVPGAVSALIDALSLSIATEPLSISSTVSILLSALAASGTVNTIDIAPGAVSVLLDALSIIGSAENMIVLLGATTVALAALGLAGSPEALTVSPGAVTAALAALSLASGASSLEILSSVNILLAAMSTTASVESLTIVPGGTSVLLTALNLAGSPGAVTVTSGAMLVALAALSLVGSAEPSTIVPGAVTTVMDALTLVCGAGGLTVSPGAVTILLSALSILSQIESLLVRMGALVYGNVDGLAVSQRNIGAISHSEVIGLIVNMIVDGDV